jgi:hypothetical protein
MTTITKQQWGLLKTILADEGIPQKWFLYKCKALRPSEIFESQMADALDRLTQLGREYRMEARNDSAQLPTGRR